MCLGVTLDGGVGSNVDINNADSMNTFYQKLKLNGIGIMAKVHCYKLMKLVYCENWYKGQWDKQTF